MHARGKHVRSNVGIGSDTAAYVTAGTIAGAILAPYVGLLSWLTF